MKEEPDLKVVSVVVKIPEERTDLREEIKQAVIDGDIALASHLHAIYKEIHRE